MTCLLTMSSFRPIVGCWLPTQITWTTWVKVTIPTPSTSCAMHRQHTRAWLKPEGIDITWQTPNQFGDTQTLVRYCFRYWVRFYSKIHPWVHSWLLSLISLSLCCCLGWVLITIPWMVRLIVWPDGIYRHLICGWLNDDVHRAWVVEHAKHKFLLQKLCTQSAIISAVNDWHSIFYYRATRFWQLFHLMCRVWG